MSFTFNVFRGSKGAKIVPDKVTRELRPHEVFIETTHTGLCGTDQHYVESGQVLGHEGVGLVRAVGSAVVTAKVGDRVGFGYMHEVCGHCDNCITGWDQYCRERKFYGGHDHDNGSFGHGAVWDEKCIFHIPEGYDSAHAAPMMCAGATIWTILTKHGAGRGQRVGVMGLGGLGHMVVKLASALGCDVVVFSSSERKRQEAMDLGASEYHVFRSGEAPSEAFKPVKHLLLTGSGAVDPSSLLPIVDFNGSIYPLTAAFEPAPVPLLDLCFKGIKIQGSLVASRDTIRNLFEFVSRKGITPTIMTYSLTPEGIENAMQELREGKVRYRAVLVREGVNE